MTTCGTGGWTGPLPGDPDNNIVLSASTGFGGVRVEWSFPSTYPWAVAYIIVYRSTSSSLATSLEIAKVSSSFYFDPNTTGVNTTYYYWVQIVTVNGTINNVVGPVSAVSKPSIADVIEDLTGAIDDGHLAPALKDKITEFTLLGGSLTDEIANRIAAQDALGLSITGLAGEVADAITVVEAQNLQRITDNDAMAAQLTLVAAGLEDSIAAVAEEFAAFSSPTGALATWKTATEVALNGNVATGAIGLVAEVDVIDGKVTNIGARYTALVTVNGLVGGFGVYNNGTSVEAGFDVDKFWIGRTAANKRKPFIVVGGVVYIDQAVINELTFTKLIDATGGFVVSGGKIKTDYLETKGLLIRDMAGNVLFGAGNALDFANVGGTTKPADGATRNVYRGAWVTATAYAIGDSVIDGGYGWTAVAAHTSSGSIKPPTYPTTSNAYWALSTVKGDAGVNTALVYAYRRSATALGSTASPGDTGDAATGASSYVFSTKTLTLPVGSSWSSTIPAGTAALYVSTAIAASTTDTDSIPAAEWTDPVILVSDGVRGTRALYDVNAGVGSAGYNSLSTYVYGANAAGSASYAAKATDLIAAATLGSTPTTPIKGDTVTFSNGTTFVNTLTYTGSVWANPGVVIDGGLLVTGSVTANKINSNGLDIRDGAGNVILSSGSGLQSQIQVNPNLVRSTASWTLGGTTSYNTLSKVTEDGTTLVIPTNVGGTAVTSPVMNLSGLGNIFTVSFRAYASVSRVLFCDLFPDTLPQLEVTLPVGWSYQQVTWTVSGTTALADLAACYLRFFGAVAAGQIEIGDIKLEVGTSRTIWVPNRLDQIGTNNKITASSITTFIEAAAIQSAQIGNLQVKSANIEELTVGTSKIANNAVTNSSGSVTSSYFPQVNWSLSTKASNLETGWINAAIGSTLVTVNLLVRESSYSATSENDAVTTVYPVRIHVYRVVGNPATYTEVFNQTGVYSFTIKDTPGADCNYIVVPEPTGGDYGAIRTGSSATVLGTKK